MYQLIDLGAVNEFSSRVEQLSDASEGRVYRFRPLEEVKAGDFWVFEQEDDEEILGGLLQIEGQRVYAISQDVFNFIHNAFSEND